MTTRLEDPVRYSLPIGDGSLRLNERIGSPLRLCWTGAILCVSCGRSIKKSFQQGYCYPCLTTLARCDSCIVRPELCHYHRGTCREKEWGEQHCLIPHTVYLANSSGVKVGITRGLDPTTRWIDQGAAHGLAIRIAANRLEAGRIEVALKAYVADKTNWRRMLKGSPDAVDLATSHDRLLEEYSRDHPNEPLPGRPAQPPTESYIEYPVSRYPEKVVSHNLHKKPVLSGTLLGIKGQYLILDEVVINVRKFGGYVVGVE